MLVKVLTIISISIPICSGHIFPQAAKEHSQNQATSSVMFQSQDAPLGYKYSSYHPPIMINQNNDKKPAGNQPIRTPSLANLPSIQYAPLIKPGELYLQNTKFNKVHFYNQQRLLDPPSKKNTKHLEPRLEGEPSVPSTAPSARSSAASAHDYQSHPLFHFDYIPGHNIQVFRSVNRSPGHNAVYRSYTDRPQSDEQNKINHLNQYIIHPSQRHHEYSTNFWINGETPSISSTGTNPSTVTTPTTTTTSTTMTTTTTKPTQRTYLLPYKETKQYYRPKPMTYKVDKPITLEKSPYTKLHSLLLNVARSYNLEKAPRRALHAGANPTLLETLHSHYNLQPQTLMKVPGSTDLHAALTDSKTILYPVQKNVHLTIRS